jgi:hypothetical protein
VHGLDQVEEHLRRGAVPAHGEVFGHARQGVARAVVGLPHGPVQVFRDVLDEAGPPVGADPQAGAPPDVGEGGCDRPAEVFAAGGLVRAQPGQQVIDAGAHPLRFGDERGLEKVVEREDRDQPVGREGNLGDPRRRMGPRHEVGEPGCCERRLRAGALQQAVAGGPVQAAALDLVGVRRDPG